MLAARLHLATKLCRNRNALRLQRSASHALKDMGTGFRSFIVNSKFKLLLTERRTLLTSSAQSFFFSYIIIIFQVHIFVDIEENGIFSNFVMLHQEALDVINSQHE